MSLIKDIYSPSFYDRFTGIICQVFPSFNKQLFITKIFDENFRNKEWKDRMKHTTIVLHEFLPADFPAAVKLMIQIIEQLKKNNFGEDNLAFMFFPDYIETYGLNHLDTSVRAFETVTRFVSCEFAVRPFIRKYGDKMIEQMIAWSLHESYKVRRLASEGSRPRLPWAMALPDLKKNPEPILPLLENLKNDPSEWVRRSVANSLNDIAKDHPLVVLNIAGRWKGISKETDAVIKHGCRTLLKQGHSEVLKHYGLNSKNLLLADFRILTPLVNIGGILDFSFSLRNEADEEQTLRLEYAVYYNKLNGQLSRKVFKISERIYQPGEEAVIRRKQSFRLITTRKFYAGPHQLAVIINGEEKAVKTFELTD